MGPHHPHFDAGRARDGPNTSLTSKYKIEKNLSILCFDTGRVRNSPNTFLALKHETEGNMAPVRLAFQVREG